VITASADLRNNSNWNAPVIMAGAFFMHYWITTLLFRPSSVRSWKRSS
jgi:hypothetical protein